VLKPSQKITTFLWFDGRAEEAARCYVSIFGKDSAGAQRATQARLQMAKIDVKTPRRAYAGR